MSDRLFALLAAILLGCTPAASTATDTNAGLRIAPRIVQPERAPVMAATMAGKRIVAVGDYGIVILSDDGRTFRQAKSVPSRAVLTSVVFIDDRRGWAAGHDGTVLASTDGGESWTVQREEPGKERVLLSIWFENERHGIAVGQFGLVLETDDGGKTWRERRLVDGGDAADRHLMHIFSGAGGPVLVAAEAGTVFRSADSGRTWQAIQTENKGSFWTGVVLGDGTALVGGMRGHIYRSEDGGIVWTKVASQTQQSLTGVLAGEDGSVRFHGIGGTLVRSTDRGRTFTATQRPDRANITAIAVGPAGDAVFTLFGAVPAK